MQSEDYYQQPDVLKIQEFQDMQRALDIEAYEILKENHPDIFNASLRLEINEVRRTAGDVIAREAVQQMQKLRPDMGIKGWF